MVTQIAVHPPASLNPEALSNKEPSPIMSTLQKAATSVPRGSRRRIAAAGAVLATVFGTALAVGAPARADSGSNGLGTAVVYSGILRSWAQGNCLDIQPGTDNVYTSGCVGGDRWQQWTVTVDTGLVQDTVTNVQTGQCLDIRPGTWNGATGQLYVSNCVYGDGWQQWNLTETSSSDGTLDVWDFQNTATRGCLDANQPQSYPYVNASCYTGGYQDWKPGF